LINGAKFIEVLEKSNLEKKLFEIWRDWQEHLINGGKFIGSQKWALNLRKKLSKKCWVNLKTKEFIMAKPKLTKFQMYALGKRANARAAWGAYAAHVSQQNFKKECVKLRSELESQGLTKNEIDKKIREFEKKQASPYLLIG
jgi:hypothetical protein